MPNNVDELLNSKIDSKLKDIMERRNIHNLGRVDYKNINVDSFYEYLIINGYYFDKNIIENYLLSLKTKHFIILTGNSGTGKTKLAQLFAKFIFSKKEIDGYKIVPVGANWTDNTNIVGYYNVIIEDYQSTPTYELIQEAQNDPDNPYFLILDEMNLSHVERYFADFLSAVESGEEIPLYGNNKKLLLPNNLFIIGTVNVDETTYMFSPKVLDRANTIEFDTLLAYDYMVSDLDDSDFNGNINYLQSLLIDSDISYLNIKDLKEILSEIKYEGDNLWKILAKELTIFQKALKSSGFDFGFRVINEILRFMVVAWRYENSPKEWKNWMRYFDAQIKQKILPKIHGSEKVIGKILTDLFNLCLIERNNNENAKNTVINKNNCRYFTSALKLQNMANILSNQRYVSFIN